METQNEKKGSIGSGRTTGQQNERSRMSSHSSQKALFNDVGKTSFLPL